MPSITVTNVAPNNGTIAGGTAITITGTGFCQPSLVSIGGNPATSIVVVDPFTITCVTPAHAAGTVDVVVTDALGTSAITAADHYTYNGAPPAVVQGGGISGGASPTLTATFVTGPTAAGSLLCAAVVSPVARTVTMPAGWVLSQAVPWLLTHTLRTYYFPNSPSVANVTMTLNANDDAALVIVEISGCDTVAPLDQSVTTSGLSSTPSTAIATTTATPEAGVAAFVSAGNMDVPASPGTNAYNAIAQPSIPPVYTLSMFARVGLGVGATSTVVTCSFVEAWTSTLDTYK